MLSLRIALRYLFSKKSHSAVNIISYVSMAGVAIAAAAMVIVMSVFNGFADFAADNFSRLDPDLLLTPVRGKTIERTDSLIDRLNSRDDIALASPRIEEKAFAAAGDRQMPLTIIGIDPEGPSAEALKSLIIDGDAVLTEGGYANTAISSVGVANTLRSTPSYPVEVKIYEPRRRGRINPANPMAAFRADSVIFAGVFRVQQQEYDNDVIFLPINVARRLLDYDTEATSVEVTLAEGADAAAVGRQIEALTGGAVIAKDRLAQEEHSMRMIEIEKWVTALMLAFILVIASFNILSSMSMLIIDKRPNRAIMNAMGETPGGIASIFAWLSFLITAIGAVIGLIIGTALTLLQQSFGFVKLYASDMSAMSIDAYPVRLAPLDPLIVAAVTIFIGFATAMIIRVTARKT